MSERHSGYEIRGPDGKWHEFLTAGKRYRVIQLFIDFDRCVHLPGEQWLFKGHDYFPHDEGTTFFVDGVDESTIRFQGDGNEILSHLEAYLAPVTSESYVAPAATRRERIMALVNAAFADLRGIDGPAQTKATPEGPLPDPPGTPFVPEITPPLPVPWPAERFVYYAYATRISGGDIAHVSDPLAIPEDVSEPWARIESGSELVLVPLSGQLKLLGRQDLKPATVRQQMVFDAGARAAPLENLLSAAGKSSAVAQLVRESYCKWQSHNLIASSVLQWHPDFAGFLDRANLVKQPVPQLGALIQPEFDRRWRLPKDRPDDWELCTTNGFPAEWPVGWKTKISYYAAAIRYDRASPVPRSREVTEPWGVVVRDGMYRPLAFTSLTADPKSLGIEPGKAQTDSFLALHKRISEVMQARQRTAIDELFFAAEQNPQIAALVGNWYQQWIDGNSLLAAWILPRHAAFAAFINGVPTARPLSSREGGYANAQAAYKRGDYKAAFGSMTEAAEEGNADAQYHLGLMYANGRGVPRDDKIAVLWYGKAAEQGEAQAQFNLGWMYANGRRVAKDEKIAVLWYTKAAEQGYARAQYNLGVRYANGQGVEKDENTALLWYGKAAVQGDSDAQYALGWMCANGRGMAKDEKAAVGWYIAAADQGNAQAQYILGWMYANGRGVAKDEKTAVLWYAKAAEQGQGQAQYHLGVMYDNGRGVEKDEKTAVLWYTKAAKQGSANAQFNLGTMYADGRGVTQDIVSAHLWFYMAARAGHAAAVKSRDLTAAQMTPIQLSRAQDRAQRCINSNYKDFD
jgi:TPR repeat protein